MTVTTPTICGAISMTSNDKQQAAMELIRLGLSLIPLVPGGKTPAGPWAHGEWTFSALMGHLAAHPDANIGVVTGSASCGLVVIDVDRHGADGRAYMRDFERANGPLEPTLSVRTPSGGTHLYYAFDETEPLPRNSANADVGVDIRGEGGYVVAPPSAIPGVGEYRFIPGRGPGEVEIAKADDTVRALIASLQGARRAKPKGPVDVASLTVREGGRNDACYRYACHTRARGGTLEDVALMTIYYNMAFCSPPLDGAELVGIISNACAHEPGEDLAAKAANLPYVGAPNMKGADSNG